MRGKSYLHIPFLKSIAFTAACAPALLHAGYTGIVLYSLATPPSEPKFAWNGAPQNAAAGEFISSAYSDSGPSDNHAVLFTPTSTGAIDLNPPGFNFTIGYGTDGTYQVGTGNGPATGGMDHALVWSGSAASAIDIDTGSVSGTIAYAISGTQVVGNGNINHALLWPTIGNSAIDLNPSGYQSSTAWGTDGSQQVGYAAVHYSPNAMLWSGSADSAVNLNPPGYSSSYANGVSHGQQVGYGFPGNAYYQQALLWNNTADSVVYLNPTDYLISEAFGTNGTQQVGQGFSSTFGQYHALLWSGTADSAVDLGTLIDSSASTFAFTIDAAGNVYGMEELNGNYFAVEWTPVPPKLGDTNLDGVINSADLTALNTGQANHLTGWSHGDFNQDGVINGDDWALFDLGVALSASNASATPEPSAAELLAILWLATLDRKRRLAS